MKTDRRFLYQKKRIAELEATVSSQRKQIELLEKEADHLKRANAIVSEKFSEVYASHEKLYSEYSGKIAEMNRIISGYDAAKRSLDVIRTEYEKKMHELLGQIAQRRSGA